MSSSDSEQITEAKHSIDDGIQALDAGDYSTAANILEQVLIDCVKQHGETAFECAKISGLYGKALLELGRTETEDALFHILSDTLRSKSKGNSEKVDWKEKLKEVTTTKAVEVGKEKPVSNENESENNADNTDTLELAWQWLETSRNIYTKKLEGCTNSDEINQYKLELADVLCSLTQLGLEIENVETALNDITECLELRNQALSDPNDRLLSETHFYRGLTLQVSKQYEEALVEFDKARQILSTLSDQTTDASTKNLYLRSLNDLDDKVIETQRLLSGEDQVESKQVNNTIKEILQPPKPVTTVDLSNKEIRCLGVFGLGQKRKREAEPDSSEPNPKQQKLEKPESDS